MSTQVPDSRRPLIIGVSVPCLLLSTTFIAVRFYGKGVLRKTIRTDDWIALAAAVVCIAVTAIPLIALSYDLGLRLQDANLAYLPSMSKIVYANGSLYPTAVGLTKISICFSYLQLFPSHTNKIFCYTMIGFVAVQTLVCLFLALFECRPIPRVWDKSIDGECLDSDISVYVNASLNSLSDLAVFLWPVKPLWGLQLPKQQRIGLIMLFSVGLVVCIVGILRIYYLTQLLSQNGDFLWNGVPIWVCSTLEVTLGIICACLTSVKLVLAKLFPTVFGSSQQSHGNTNGRSYTRYGPRTGRKTTRAESFAFEQLSSSQRDIIRHPGDDKGSVDFEAAAGTTRHVDSALKNNVWVGTTTLVAPSQVVPANAIGVSREITINNEAMGNTTPRNGNGKPSDTSSEEWILEGDGNSKRAQRK